jgi:hypothetical protein
MMSNHDFSDDSTQLLSFSSWFGLRFMMFNATFNNISGMRKTVLSLGHDVLLAGHLGTKKTRDRIMRHFFWPGIFTDISEY